MNKPAYLLLFLLGILFTAGGIVLIQQTALPTYQSWQTMRHWQPASATLLDVSGDRNDAQARYVYRIDGVEYHNDRVYVATFQDTIGHYHQEMIARLKQMQQNGQRIPIWYDPEDPAQSIIDKDMRWGLFALVSGFAFILIIIGLNLCRTALRPKVGTTFKDHIPSLSDLWQQWKLEQLHRNGQVRLSDFLLQLNTQYRQAIETVPASKRHDLDASPWLKNKGWRQNRIRSSVKSALFGIGFFAVVWNAFCLPFLFVIYNELKQGHYAILLGLPLPLIGLFLLGKTWRIYHDWLRFGVIELEMDPFPGAIGGHVGGSLMLSKGGNLRIPYQVKLECVQTILSYKGGHSRSQREMVKWSEQGTAIAKAAGQGIRLEFRFDVPGQLPESEMNQWGEHIYWRLTLSTDSDDVQLKREYQIPVFYTQARSRYIDHDNSARAAEIRRKEEEISRAAVHRGDFASTTLSRTFVFRNRGNEQRFYYPMFRNKLATAFALTFAVGFDFAALMIGLDFFTNNGMEGKVMLIFALPFGLIGLVATIASLYLPLNTLCVTLGNGQISALRRWLFIPLSYRSLSAREIRHIEINSSGISAEGVDQIKQFKLVVHGRQGQRFTIAENIMGEPLAGQLKEFIERRLGIAA